MWPNIFRELVLVLRFILKKNWRTFLADSSYGTFAILKSLLFCCRLRRKLILML